jgi:hypothetical protein
MDVVHEHEENGEAAQEVHAFEAMPVMGAR